MCAKEQFVEEFNDVQKEIYRDIYEDTKFIHAVICNYIIFIGDKEYGEKARINLCRGLEKVIEGKKEWSFIYNSVDDNEFRLMLDSIKPSFDNLLTLRQNYIPQEFSKLVYSTLVYPCGSFPLLENIPSSVNRLK